MKAVHFTKYGPPELLQFKDFEKPVPKDDEVLVKIHASSLNAADWHYQRADPILIRFTMGFSTPKYPIPGMDLSGTVEAVGKNVTRWKPGDEIIGDMYNANLGAFAEYKAIPESILASKPKNMSFEEAAALPLAGNTALRACRDVAKIEKGQDVLIYGSGGGVGTFLVQMAKIFGANVTAVCSERNAKQSSDLGADRVIDYRKEDALSGDSKYDVIFGVNGSRRLAEFKRALKPKGLYAMVGGSNSQMFEALFKGSFISKKDGMRFTFVDAKTTPENLEELHGYVEAGKLKSVVDKVYPLDDFVEAFNYLETHHAKGKIVIKHS